MADSLKEKFNNLLHEAMKNKDDVARDTMRLLLTNLKLLEVEKKQTLDDTAILALIQKEIKSRHESIEEFKKGNRQDLVERSQAEIKVLEQFLPKQLSDEEVKAIVTATVAEIGATSMADMGKVMKAALPKMQGQAASDRVSAMVKELLQK
ncbi:MAG: GatB/YqeY domain-containing protein [Anaerolineaceae bacterium]|nr:GatB/YqeY domain-containing protein [Anaerolineaceae bacterium]